MKQFLLFATAFFCIAGSYAQPNLQQADSLLNFIVQNKNKAALYLVRNDTVLAKQNENKLMPLASTVKIMVAVEFAKQVSAEIINPNMYVPLKELDKYYLPDTDGNAHPDWLANEKKLNHIKNDSIQLLYIARGMIQFSSNANTEYLMDLLGLDNVKNNIQLFGLTQHTAIYPLVSSLFMYQNPKNLKEDKILKSIKKMPEEMYCKAIAMIHTQLKYDKYFKSKFRLQDLSMKMQKVWSDKLPAGTVKEYAQIGKILNNRRYLDANAYGVLSEVLETIMETPGMNKFFKHTGSKGGSTAWVLTKAAYATMQKGTRVELAYFFNDLTPQEMQQIGSWMDMFEFRVFIDESFRMSVKKAIGN